MKKPLLHVSIIQCSSWRIPTNERHVIVYLFKFGSMYKIEFSILQLHTCLCLKKVASFFIILHLSYYIYTVCSYHNCMSCKMYVRNIIFCSTDVLYKTLHPPLINGNQ